MHALIQLNEYCRPMISQQNNNLPQQNIWIITKAMDLEKSVEITCLMWMLWCNNQSNIADYRIYRCYKTDLIVDIIIKDVNLAFSQ